MFDRFRGPWLRVIVPAIYCALILMGAFRSIEEVSVAALVALGGYTTYMAWRIYAIYEERAGGGGKAMGGIPAVEIGLLTVLATATLHQLLVEIAPYWNATHAVLVVGLAAFVRLPELALLPLCAVLVGMAAQGGWDMKWLVAFIELELIALAAGGVLALERGRFGKLSRSFQRLRLEAEHMHHREDGLPTEAKKGELSRINETLYAYLKEVKQNTGAYSVVLAVISGDGHFYVRELVSDSNTLREDAGLNLQGKAFKWVVKNNKHLLISSLSDPGAALGYYTGKEAVRSFLGVPVVTGDTVEGVLSVDSRETDAFGEEKLSVLRVASHQVATLLTQLRQLEQVRREARDFKSLHDFSKQLNVCEDENELVSLVLRILSQRNRPNFSAMVFVDEQGELTLERVGEAQWRQLEGQKFPASDGLVGWALESGHYLYYDQERPSARRPVFTDKIKLPKFQSLLIHPFSRPEEPLGALVLGFEGPSALDTAAIAFCDILSQQVTLGLMQIRSVAKLREMATVDGLTKLCNRRVFFEAAQEEFKRAQRYPTPLTVVTFDIDHFKKINDTYGHAVGDIVLREFSALLQRHARDTDLAARIGGEEFAMLVPNTDEDGTHILAERIRQSTKALEIKCDDAVIKITVSAGIAQHRDDEVHSVEHLLERADQALYAAKEDGRDRVVCYCDIEDYINWGG